MGQAFYEGGVENQGILFNIKNRPIGGSGRDQKQLKRRRIYVENVKKL